MNHQNGELLRVEGLKKYFPVRKGIFSRTVGHVKAVDDVSFHVNKGETLGLVGESGCGKTTTGRTVLRLIEPTTGKITFDKNDVCEMEGSKLRQLRRDMQIIFQDPYSSLNPRMTVGSIIGEGLTIHKIARGRDREEMVRDLLQKVGLDPNYINRYPHEFSGGQRQRIGIARAIALKPSFIVCDEPVSALDVSIQAQIINLMIDLKNDLNLSYLFISHDLSVVEYICDRVAVMYLGEIVELATSESLYKNPLHPYTKALLSATPTMDPTNKKKRIILSGDVPSPINPPSGCRFHPRCPIAEDRCKSEVPQEQSFNGHTVRCHLVKDGVAPEFAHS